MKTVTDLVTQRIRRKQKGWVFTPKDFLDIGTRAAIDKILSRLTQKGLVRRLAKGIYDFPKTNDLVGILSPRTNDIARAVAKKRGIKVIVSGATSANMLGLSMQVPAKAIYATNGTTRSRMITNQIITLQHSRIPILDNVPDKVNLTLQALSYIGKKNIDNDIIDKCASALDDANMAALAKAVTQVPCWMSDAIHKIQDRRNG
jgi:hypothetical protein